jgi:2-iminobutanoate/2-iminopropanoate deaminase
MKRGVLKSNKLAKSLGVYSSGIEVTEAKKLIFVSGQIAQDSEGNIVGKGDIHAQTKQVLENVKAVLEQAGATMENIVKVTVYVTDMNNFKGVHEIRAQYFQNDPPASTLVEVSKLALDELLVEIEAMAVI